MSTDTPTTPTHVPEHDSDEQDHEVDTESNREPATIASSPNGERRGVAIYLTADDLRRLGIPHDVNAVVPCILNGAVLIKSTT
ncbi:hypothetical protein [Halobaculum rarum]|uniref:hypothetical protein n=1 Tax=Halobaculum rarum TaxID=3075122 RepID=UPI0032AFB19C